ncbi:MAG: Histidinol-phosphate aminotransferase [Candidatus Gottesmanbacteria bacterium GW2011_GWC2_39_8]|uniref:Histidinol-phosphate aminotransferase n=1 Tax=Candidatus Gottesmanbacteria bacterium GW2011_GWC2_39_8 TaxID=1618450 RepID=A0A0G0T2E3_9BACT|nr:MAG: Histidinol-phosphate aminotransferase [Candidatus Gottesmanbacteria bacterium GW2011_GWC2_39_8]
MKNKIEWLVRKQILNMKEINWGDIPDDTPFRLLWGENQQVLDVYRKAIVNEIDKINLYPSPTKLKLREKIARYNKVRSDNVLVTNGSDEALELIAKVFIEENDEVITAIPSFPVYLSVSVMMGAKIISVPLNSNFELDIDKLLRRVNSKTKIIWIANPNNPTGNILLSIVQIKRILEKIECILVIDECYFELTNISAKKLIKRYPNLIITRSFTKIFALGGVRLGYILADVRTVSYLSRLQQNNQAFNVNRFAIAAGIAILDKPQLIKKSIDDFIRSKDNFESLLKEIPSLKIICTKTTFCLLKLPEQISAGELKKELAEKNIFIKDCSMYKNLGKQYMYLGIPLIKYQKQVVRIIKNIMEEKIC